jgi:hypothetical protein
MQFRKRTAPSSKQRFFFLPCRFCTGRLDHLARREIPAPRSTPRSQKGCVMDMSTMIASHLSEATKRGNATEFHWESHEAYNAVARLFAATVIVAVAVAALGVGSSRLPEGDMAARADGITASTGRHSPR